MSEEFKMNVKIDGKDAELTIVSEELNRVVREYYDSRFKKNAKAAILSDAEILRKAAEVVVEVGKCSTALLQRRLLIGYGRAARLVDELEAKGVIGPARGGNEPREVMISSMDEYTD